MYMKFATGILAVTSLLAAAPLYAEDEVPPVQMTEDEAQQIQTALNLGYDLYRYDQAAWHATDELLKEIPRTREVGVHGWVVEPSESGHIVTFWVLEGDAYFRVFAADYDGTSVVSHESFVGKRTPLTQIQVEMVRALEAAKGQELWGCSEEPFNSVVLPTSKPEGGYYVYLLVPQSDFRSVPLGGHFRTEVRDGKVVNHRSFTNSCIALDLGNVESGKRPEALMISHLLDPVPTEVHVFSTFVAKVPIYVATEGNDHIWVTEISGGVPRIRLVK